MDQISFTNKISGRKNMTLLGRILIISGISFMFIAYSQFIPTSLSTPLIADYVKNHFIREVTFGLTLASITIYFTFKAQTLQDWRRVSILGTIVVIPFWVAWTFGWSTGGISEVWGDSISPNGAYMIHVPQITLFFSGLAVLFFSLRKKAATSAHSY
ncbi:hypothetical protein [Leisingera sp. MMG026]|uniref:hypothetical protein n=1 Tax=Leisingera sp. MMG026 TaxID=2909982 RepID=UPI001F2032E4|nr:hypothetical protein [Leisingera sp. MMG026]MCF6433732.1 hypothetical protein [Leisingera sp. MMG026]